MKKGLKKKTFYFFKKSSLFIKTDCFFFSFLWIHWWNGLTQRPRQWNVPNHKHCYGYFEARVAQSILSFHFRGPQEYSSTPPIPPLPTHASLSVSPSHIYFSWTPVEYLRPCDRMLNLMPNLTRALCWTPFVMWALLIRQRGAGCCWWPGCSSGAPIVQPWQRVPELSGLTVTGPSRQGTGSPENSQGS